MARASGGGAAWRRANGQGDGTRSYGRMVDLLLADRRARVAG